MKLNTPRMWGSNDEMLRFCQKPNFSSRGRPARKKKGARSSQTRRSKSQGEI